MLLLASASPRRKELLTQAGLSFEVRASDADESVPSKTSPREAVLLLAERKARAVFKGCSPADTVLGADTMVALDGVIFGKPANELEAAQTLAALSGRTHSVFTGFCVLNGENCVLEAVETRVTFWPLSQKEIDDYIRTGEPADKAGAYGIQGLGALLVRRISGDYCNVVGLPLSRICRVLRAL